MSLKCFLKSISWEFASWKKRVFENFNTFCIQLYFIIILCQIFFLKTSEDKGKICPIIPYLTPKFFWFLILCSKFNLNFNNYYYCTKVSVRYNLPKWNYQQIFLVKASVYCFIKYVVSKDLPKNFDFLNVSTDYIIDNDCCISRNVGRTKINLVTLNNLSFFKDKLQFSVEIAHCLKSAISIFKKFFLVLTNKLGTRL